MTKKPNTIIIEVPREEFEEGIIPYVDVDGAWHKLLVADKLVIPGYYTRESIEDIAGGEVSDDAFEEVQHRASDCEPIDVSIRVLVEDAESEYPLEEENNEDDTTP